MDKNTITGIILMCAVVFGFMYLNQPSEEELAAQRKAQQELAEQEKATSQVKPGEAVVDSLSSADWAMLDSLAREKAIAVNGIEIKSVDGALSGYVSAKGKKIDIQELKGSKSGDAASHNAAVISVKQLLDKYIKNSTFASSLSGTEQKFTLRNDSLEVELSTHGGTVTRATLRTYKAYHSQEDYKSNKSEPVELVNAENNSFGFIINDAAQAFDTRDFYFDGKQLNDSTVAMTLNAGAGATFTVTYTLVPGTYMLAMDVTQQGMDKVIAGNVTNLDVVWSQKLRRQEVGKTFEERNSGLYYKVQGESGDVDHLTENGDKDETTQEKMKWFSSKSQFFSTVLIAEGAFNGAEMHSHAYEEGRDKGYNTYLKDLSVNTSVDYQAANPKVGKFFFYFGPNKYKVLSSYDRFSPKEDLKLTRLVSLGWTLFRWINTGIVIPVFNWLGSFGWSYGIIILILTILLKLVLSPLTFKSYMSQAKMRVLQPDIKALNEKYPNPEDAMKKQQKTMELYRQAGANPMGGCLPMLLQMPILIAMFWFFPSSIELRGQSFLWAPDLSAPDAIISLPFSIPMLGDHLSIFCLIMTVTNIVYTYINMQSQSSSQMPGMKWMMYLMPLMFLFFFNQYASGLSYYYFVSLLLTIIQTYVCRMFVDEEKVRQTMAENAKKPRKKSGFMARLEEAQRLQQQQMKAQQKRNNRR